MGLTIDYVLVAGGQGEEDLDSSEVLNLSTGHWQAAGNMSGHKEGLRLAVVEGGKVVATGLGHMKDVEKFDTILQQWRSVETRLMLSRNNHAITSVPSSFLSCD